MAVKHTDAEDEAFEKAGANINEVSLQDEVSRSFLEYSYSVITSRALPDARDGLKPVHRRILYSMADAGLRPDHAYVKSARVVGAVMGSLHPHGDSAIYEALVRLAQPFSQNSILIDGNGNFGSPNDSAAASRYTECRLAKPAMLLVSELEEGTVDWKPNYDGSLLEPTVLPAAYPNLLVNGGAGIAVGMATNMIPHNLNEAVNAARLILKNPNATLDQLMEIIPGPDLPTGGIILGLDEVRKAYEEGKGSVRIRAKVEIMPLEGSRGRSSLVATELPYGVGSEKIIEKIKEEINKKRLQGISDVKDLSDRRNGTRLVIECKTGVNPQILLNELYRLTPLEVSFGISNLALVNGQPQTLGLKEMLTVFVDHRLEVVTRRTQHRLDKALARKHIVEGLLIALDNIDAVVKIIRASKDTAEAKKNLMAKFKLSDIQTGYILEMPLRRLVSLEVESLRKELVELEKAIEGYNRILNDEKELRKVVDKELAAVNEAIVTERQTHLMGGDLKEVLAESAALSAPLEVEDEPCKVLFSRTGLLARTPVKSEQLTEMRAKSGRSKHDAVHSVITTSTRSQILAVTSKGRAVKVDVLALPSLPLVLSGNVNVSGGMPTREVITLEKDETVVGISPLTTEGLYGIAIGTRNGIVKITAPDFPTRGEEFPIIGLKDDDEVVAAFSLTDDTGDIVFISSDSSLLHYPVKNVRPQGRSGGGMAGIKLAADQHVVAFAVAKNAVFAGETFEPVVATFTGVSVKLTPFSAYPAKGRGTGGVRSHRFLKGEDHLETAWVGPRPVASSLKGEPLELPDMDPRRDGSGTPAENISLIGGQQSRTNPVK